MRSIAFVTTQDFVPWGGSEELWSRAALRFAQRGIRVSASVYEFPHESPRVRELERGGVTVKRQKRGHTLTSRTLNRILARHPDAQKISQARRWLAAVAPDLLVINVTLAPQGGEWARAASELNIPFVIVNQLAVDAIWPDSDRQLFHAAGYRAARKVFVLSRRNYLAICKQLCWDLPNVEWFFNPFNVDASTPFSFPSLENGIRFASVARLGIEHKRQDILLEILNERRWRERNVSLSFFGDGMHGGCLKNLAGHYGLRNVTFHGAVRDIDAIWRDHHALLMPSAFEGMSLAMLEALLCYRICVVTNVGGVEELLTDNVTGFVAAAATTELFAEAMERAWNVRTKWPDIAKQAGEMVRQHIPADPVEDFMQKLDACP